MEQTQGIRLKLPEQDLEFLTVGSEQPKKLKAWIESLPTMNLGETSKQLYQYIQELNRLKVDARTRFALLETLRPTLLMVTHGLSKHYLSQSLVLPDKARRVASLAQSLQGHLANGYKLVVAGCLRKASDKENRQTLPVALHRAITAMTDVLLRCYQLYFPTPRNLWLELHQLYLLSELQQVHEIEVSDQEFRSIESSTAPDAYARALLLATAKPNQLRQKELAVIYDATEEWSGLVEIKHAAGNEDLFVFDLQADRPPTYRTHVSVAKEACRYIDASALMIRINATAEAQKPADFDIPRDMSDNLLLHLQRSWGALTERSFARVSQQVPLDLCFGLGALHHFSSRGQDFSEIVNTGQTLADENVNPFLQERKSGGRPSVDHLDPWSQAYDGGGYRMSQDAELDSIDVSRITSALQKQKKQEGRTQKFDQFHCETINVSPGGYCVGWQGETPSQLRTGELVGILEERNQEWAVGVLRWVKQLSSQGAQFGVELLAPRALPAGGRVVKKTGESGEFLRVLLLPEMPAIGQPLTLLVPAVGFQTGAKVELIQGGQGNRIQLTRKVNSTASFGQYEFRLTGAKAEVTEGADDFSSIWSSI